MILSDRELRRRGHELLEPFTEAFVNPASIDICIGKTLIEEDISIDDGGRQFDLDLRTKDNPYWLLPGQFVLVATLERLKVPLDLAMDLRLKSSRAREGYSHLLAFWFDPGWDGIGTLELTNVNQYRSLPLYPGLRIGQVIYHRLTEAPERPYQGKYQHADDVEGAKGD